MSKIYLKGRMIDSELKEFISNKISDFKKNKNPIKNNEIINLIKNETENLKNLLDEKYVYSTEEERRPNLYLDPNSKYIIIYSCLILLKLINNLN